jgi:hypothetical protein
MVTRGAVGGDRDELIEEAPAFVLGPREGGRPRIASYNPSSGSLQGLLYAMLKRAWYSRLRKQKPMSGLLGDIQAPQMPDRFSLFGESFSARDLEALAGWAAADRILVLCLTGLWLKVRPESTWRAWVEECGLGWPFPGDDFLRADDPRRWLAQALGITIQVLYARWHRKGKLLAGLPDFSGSFSVESG